MTNPFYKSSFNKNFVNASKKKKGQLNKTEQRYRGQLELMLQANEIQDFGVQEITLLIGRVETGKNHYYTPDFHVITNDNRMLFIEVKGGKITQDGRNVFKDACEKHLWADFMMVQLDKGEWKIVMVG